MIITLYVRELLYKTRLTNNDLIDELKKMNLRKNAYIFCDAEDPPRIEEIYRAGFNAVKSMKEVKQGIDFVKRFKLKITKSSINLIKEIKSYSWKVDKNGKILDEPVKFNDHLMDAMRYAVYSYFKQFNIAEKSKAIDTLIDFYS